MLPPQTSLNIIPMAMVIDCKYIQDSGGNVLMMSYQDPSSNQPRVHFFQCTKGSVRTMYNWMKIASLFKPLHNMITYIEEVTAWGICAVTLVVVV